MNSSDNSQFKRQIEAAFTLKVLNRSDEALRAAYLAIGAAVTLGTPVGNPSLWKSKPPPGYVGGTARRNWQASLNAPASGEMRETDPSGAAALRLQETTAGQFTTRRHQSIWLTNNLPYIGALNDGWSTQAPAGFVEEAIRVGVELINKEYGR